MGRDEIAEALQQMTGYNVGKFGDIKELVSSMGLNKDEWEHIKENEESGHLNEEDIEDINDYFAKSGQGEQ